ncbi:hypothetical protein ACJ73_09105 [Blastomyces percursus]|uniref:Mid2 domain-containing protein n=1 Tax=Blastomyces percursus TaxID=1658174 RepID=A0A1J9PDY5_9EURO|nr:hypothetical protein ACJ73_09105 [Blastomyces percursus]
MKLLHSAYCILGFAYTVSAVCYYRNGNVTPADVPCHDTGPSTCCPVGYACLSNNVCVNPKAENETVGYIRGSCTDKSWRAGQCPAFCIRGGKPWNDTLGGVQPMRKCENTDEDLYYCVDDNVGAVDCDAKNDAVVSFVGQPTTVTVIGATQTNSPTPTATSTPDGGGLDAAKTAAIGAGVGVPIGVVLIALIAIFAFWRRRKRSRKAKEATSHEQQSETYKKQGPYMEAELIEAPRNEIVEAPSSPAVGRKPHTALPTSPVELPAQPK